MVAISVQFENTSGVLSQKLETGGSGRRCWECSYDVIVVEGWEPQTKCDSLVLGDG